MFIVNFRDHAAHPRSRTNDPIKGWRGRLSGMVVFFQSFIPDGIGGFRSQPYIRQDHARAQRFLGTPPPGVLPSRFISMRPALEMFMTPESSVLTCFAIIMVKLVRWLQISQGHSGPGSLPSPVGPWIIALGVPTCSALGYGET